MKKIIVLIIILCVLIGIFYGVVYRRSTESRSQIHMGTVCEITMVDFSSSGRAKAFEDAFRMIKVSEERMSIFDDKSDVMRINKYAFQQPVYVSQDVIFIIEQSIYFSNITQGAFDITTLPLSRLWGFASQSRTFPSPDEIKSTLNNIGYHNIKLGEDEKGKRYIKFDGEGVEIDLGGVAKGYVCDLVVTSLKRNGIKSALVNIGGTIFAYGKPLGKKNWTVGIRHPRDSRKINQTVILDEKAISTSGDYEQFFMHEGKRYSHILDPNSGYPVQDIISVSVIAPSAMVADALSTGIFVLGVEEGLLLARRLEGVEAYIVYQDGNEIKTISSEDIPQ